MCSKIFYQLILITLENIFIILYNYFIKLNNLKYFLNIFDILILLKFITVFKTIQL